jgi:16S rRNA (adenine1518-N6/adenine1519-N6)-dimethyltransferase
VFWQTETKNPAKLDWFQYSLGLSSSQHPLTFSVHTRKGEGQPLSKMTYLSQKPQLSPKKSLGQHFLADKNILATIVSAAEVSENDIVLEIGPGTGTLTAALAGHAKQVIAVEKDRELCALLEKKFAEYANVKIVCADVLKINPNYHLPITNYKIVANIPYYITGRLLRLMFEGWQRPAAAVLMLQKEVAERICAKPPKMNRLAAIAQNFTEPKIITIVRRGAFSPLPKVDSSIIALKNFQKPRPDDRQTISLISAGFSQPRKLLVSNLDKYFPEQKQKIIDALKKLDLSPQVRPAELSPSQWKKLSTLLFPRDKV